MDTGRVITSAGISAGIDMSLHIVRRILGEAHALKVAAYMEYQWRAMPRGHRSGRCQGGHRLRLGTVTERVFDRRHGVGVGLRESQRLIERPHRVVPQKGLCPPGCCVPQDAVSPRMLCPPGCCVPRMLCPPGCCVPQDAVSPRMLCPPGCCVPQDAVSPRMLCPPGCCVPRMS